ncbi:FKBP-type peptidyl-prolyl cis-trans isomerase [Nonomuraea sp. NPDC052116]|uniref:FKBP-type peptidyl-prolyl cis-trans isomerase n=1 Tax=Nonomuraea sp. NPDC052116 TaxID=3155665 RepID=UPI0034224332
MRLFLPAVLMLATSCGLAEEGTQPIVTGAFGTKPVVAIPKGSPGRTPRITVLSTGSGRRTLPGDVVLADVDIRRWSGNQPYLSTYDGHQPTSVVFDGRRVTETWRQALIGRSAGSRIMLVSQAGEALGPDAPLTLTDLAPADTLVLIFDVLGGYPPDARLVGRALPVVPADLVPGSPPRTLIAGSGEEVMAGSKVVVQYVAASWPERTVVDSSYRKGGPSAYTLKEGDVPDGWLGALVGRQVGSRVAVSGLGDRPSLYVIDVLGTVHV